MKRRVLLDANLLIGAYEPEPGNLEHEKAGKKLRELMNDPDVEVFITSLIRYEVLRGVQRIPLTDMKAKLNAIQELPIREKEAGRAVELYRLVEENGLSQPSEKVCPECKRRLPGKDACPECGRHPLDKRSFDILHFACADINGLEIESKDQHFETLRQLSQNAHDACGSTAHPSAIPQENNSCPNALT
jgi:predicted nucleic acid-binding protein